MELDLIQTIITGAPNFFGFILAMFLLMRIIGRQYELIILLIERWENCESEVDRQNSIKVLDSKS